MISPVQERKLLLHPSPALLTFSQNPFVILDAPA